MNTLTIKCTFGLACLCSLPMALTVHAEERVVREYSYDLSDIREVEFKAGAGSLRIVPATGDEVRLVLEIEGNDDGWFSGPKDVSGVELESSVRGDRLILEQTEDDTNTEWTVQLPAVARTSIEMGVGEIDAEFGATELSIDLGVGDIDVSAPEASVGAIELSVGVGEASLRGASEREENRKFISQDVTGHGLGMLDMEVKLGVGEINVTLE